MILSFELLQLPADSEDLIAFLTSQDWPFHGHGRPDRERVLRGIESGFYESSNHRSFWALGPQGEKWGLIRLFDLDDIPGGYPLFDLRIAESQRGQGLGFQAVKWLTSYLFETWPELQRVEGTTRVDNVAMRRAFVKSGYAKEGHYRKAWDGVDSIHYGILRQDWLSGGVTLVDWDDEPAARK